MNDDDNNDHHDHDDDDDGMVHVAIEMTEPSQQRHPQSPPPTILSSSSTHSSGADRSTRNDDDDDLGDQSRHNRGMKITTANETPTLPTVMKEKTRTFLHRFFYPHQHKQEYIGTTSNTTSGPDLAESPHNVNPAPLPTRHLSNRNNGNGDDPLQQPQPLQQSPSQLRNNNTSNNMDSATGTTSIHHHTIETKHTPNHNDELRQSYAPDMNDPDVKFVTNFWTTYDDILILSIFTQLGIVFRLAIAIWFKYFDDVFSNDSALFVNLPLNCLSCFFMGLLCSGERLMETISTRFSPTETQQTIVSLPSSTQPHLRPYRDQNIIDDDYDENEDEDDYNQRFHSSGNSNNNSIHNHNSNDGLVIRSHELRQRHAVYHPEPHRSRLDDILRRRRRRPKRDKQGYRRNEPRFVSWQPPVSLDAELRDVQLLALERRIRLSKCLVLFPVRKQDVDVMEHYFQQGYKRNDESYFAGAEREDHVMGGNHTSTTTEKFVIDESSDDEVVSGDVTVRPRRLEDGLTRSGERLPHYPTSPSAPLHGTNNGNNNNTNNTIKQTPIISPGETTEPTSATPSTLSGAAANTAAASGDAAAATSADYYITDITDLANNIQDNVQENLYRLRRVNLADGWDTGTTASAMSDDLMLGLRDGFCGALSSFSSWNSAMVSLLRKGQFTQALVGYMIGLQLPIVAYRFGQHVAVYIFIWRTRQETHRDQRRGGYGIRLANHDDDDDDDDIEQRKGDGEDDDSDEDDEEKKRKAAENEMPSLRAVITAIFIMAIVTQCTSIFFYNSPKDQQIAMSLLFSPLGVLARWRLTKLNRWKPTFPLGTFTCNILACALSGSLGEKDQVVLVSIVNGFGGTLSSLASFVVEILAGIDPILFRFDGVIYAAASIGCAIVVGFIFSASVEWADSFVARSASVSSNDIDVVVSNVTENLTSVVNNVTDNLSRYW